MNHKVWRALLLSALLTAGQAACVHQDDEGSVPGGENISRPGRSLNAPGPVPATACGKIAQEGCCSGETLYFCAAGVLKTLDCNKNLKCGWYKSMMAYTCGTNGDPDPSGKFPKSCAGLLGDGGPSPFDKGSPDKSSEDLGSEDLGSEDQGSEDQGQADSAPGADTRPAADTDNGLPEAGLDRAAAQKDLGGGGEPENDGGCTCAQAGAPQGAGLALMPLVLGLLVLLRRRKRHGLAGDDEKVTSRTGVALRVAGGGDSKLRHRRQHGVCFQRLPARGCDSQLAWPCLRRVGAAEFPSHTTRNHALKLAQ